MVTLQYLNKEEIMLLQLMINSVDEGVNSLEDYWYPENKLISFTEIKKMDKSIIGELNFCEILEKKVTRYCYNCEENIDDCDCEEPDIHEESYYRIRIKKLVDYFKETFSYLYNINLEDEVKSDIKITNIIKNYDVKLDIYLNNIEDEYVYSLNLKDRIVVSIMPLHKATREQGIYEWHELLDSNTIDSLKVKIKDIRNSSASEDFYYFDLGDDLQVEEVETIRNVLEKFLELNQYREYTDNKSYKPEYIDYAIPLDKIKTCFIKDDSKIFILKPTEKQIKVAYFRNGVIGDDKDVYSLVRKFDKFIKNKTRKYRRIKSLEMKSDKTQKIIQLVGPIINILTILYTLIGKNNIFNVNLDLLLQYKKILIYGYVVINVISIIFIVACSILPYFFRIFFSWTFRLKKIINKNVI